MSLLLQSHSSDCGLGRQTLFTTGQGARLLAERASSWQSGKNKPKADRKNLSYSKTLFLFKCKLVTYSAFWLILQRKAQTLDLSIYLMGLGGGGGGRGGGGGGGGGGAGFSDWCIRFWSSSTAQEKKPPVRSLLLTSALRTTLAS